MSIMQKKHIQITASLLVCGIVGAASRAGEPTASSGHQHRAGDHGMPDLEQGTATFDPAITNELQVKRVKTGHLLVRPVINGLDAGWFIFDTGAGICVVSTPCVNRLKLKRLGDIDAQGTGGDEEAKLYRASTVKLGPLTLTDHPIMATDLSFLKVHMGVEIA